MIDVRARTAPGPEAPEAPARRETPPALSAEEGALRAAPLLALAWALIYLSATRLRPPATNDSLWLMVPEVVFWGAATVGALGAVRGWRVGFTASIVAMSAVIACPVAGHHMVGAWFPVQLVGAMALVGANVVAGTGRR